MLSSMLGSTTFSKLADLLTNMMLFWRWPEKQVADQPEQSVRSEVAERRPGNTALLWADLRLTLRASLRPCEKSCFGRYFDPYARGEIRRFCRCIA